METSVKISSALLFSLMACISAFAGFQIWLTTTKASMQESTTFYADTKQTVNTSIQGKQFPILEVENQRILLGDSFSALDIVSARDIEDGDLHAKIDVYGEVDTNTKGEYVIHYIVRNHYGLKSEKRIKVIVD